MYMYMYMCMCVRVCARARVYTHVFVGPRTGVGYTAGQLSP